MRKALNENPTVQMAVIGVIGVVLAFMLFTTVLKGEEEPAAESAAAADPAAAAVPAVEAPASPAPVTPAAAAPDSAAAPAGAVEIEAGDGLPKEVVNAYSGNETIALLVIDPDGISDRQVKTWTETLSGEENVSVFVVDVKDIADYSRLTSGVGLSQTPALMVVTPRNLSDGVPESSISYGFRSQRSIEQALDDATYKAGPVNSYP